MRAILALCGLLVLASAPHFIASALADIASGPTTVKPLLVGDRAPAFAVRHTDGTPYKFSPEHLVRPQVLIFYRGGWCPYCNMQLNDLRLVEPKLRASGFEILFFSTDRPKLLYSSLKAQNITYTLLSDSEMHAAEAFHIAYHVDDATYATELKYGVDLEKTTGTKKRELPVPTVLILDSSGVIRFVYSNPDYRVRLGADALWEAAKPFANSR